MHLKETKSNLLKFRFVKAEDSRMIWEWANDSTIRSVSFSPAPIPWENHSKWFSAKILDPNCLFFLILGPDDLPIGQIRYEVDRNEAVVSVALAPGERGKGYGSQAIRLGSQRVFDNTPIQLIHAYIKPDNLASIRAFANAGFSDSGLVEIRGNLARDYIIQRNSTNRP